MSKMKMDLKQFANIIDVNVRLLWHVSLGGSAKQIELFKRMENVEIGDLVLEITTANHGVPAFNRLGYLREVKKIEGGLKHYYIERLDGTITNWSNCTMIKVPTEFRYLTHY